MYQGEFDLLGFKIGNFYFIDKCLPMGCSASCSHFERFSSFLLKNIIALAPFHQEFELSSFQCQLKGPNKLFLLMDLPLYHQLLGHLIVNKLR
jgi:hypothetical protein